VEQFRGRKVKGQGQYVAVRLCLVIDDYCYFAEYFRCHFYEPDDLRYHQQTVVVEGRCRQDWSVGVTPQCGYYSSVAEHHPDVDDSSLQRLL